MQSPLKILFVDDHRGLRDGMIFMLQSKNPALSISGANDIDEAISKLNADSEIRIVILDLTLDGENSLDSIPKIKESAPNASILVYTMHNDEVHVEKALLSGIQGFVTKEAPIEELEKAIVAISDGNTYFNSVASKVLQTLLPQNRGKHYVYDEKSYLFDNYKCLSKKEHEVFNYLIKGKSISDIAKILKKAEKTILNQRASIYSKLDIHDRYELMETAKLLGLVF